MTAITITNIKTPEALQNICNGSNMKKKQQPSVMIPKSLHERFIIWSQKKRCQKTISQEKIRCSAALMRLNKRPTPLPLLWTAVCAQSGRITQGKIVVKEEDEHLLYWQFLPMYSPGHSHE